MATNAPPSRNPANNDSLQGVFDVVLDKFIQNYLDDMLPAQVIAYNRATNIAQVQAVISIVTTDAQIVSRAQVASVPVFRYGGGGAAGFFMNHPLVAGDTGWLKANDRDISLWKQTGQPSPPNTNRKHQFADGMFFPDYVFGGDIASEDITNGNSVWQNASGTVKIALWSTFVKILSQVGIGGTPNASALLDLQSTTKALLVPRMTTAQKLAIPNPVDGMMVYDTVEKSFAYHSNGSWS